VNVLDLFSGIGGFSLGLERAGMRTVAFCEIDPYARAVLRKHWPDVPCYDDVRTVTADRLAADGIIAPTDAVADTDCGRCGQAPTREVEQPRRAETIGTGIDVICGGFPCQDISHAGKGAGLAGERSGLWSEIARLVGELRPRYVIVENVSALLGRGLDRVLGDLAEVGYDAEWHCIPASAVGAPHRRDRIWIVAYASGAGSKARSGDGMGVDHGSRGHQGQLASSCGEAAVADAQESRLEGWRERRRFRPELTGPGESGGSVSDFWRTEPDVGRVAHGVPSRVDRLRCLGNAVVPQVVEVIGRAIMAADMQRLRNDEREFRSESDERLIAPFNAVTIK
jgi:DNA (cytosine-5)-methyltransferase 1